MLDSQTDVIGVITRLFNRVYVRDCNATILGAVTKASGIKKTQVTGLTTVAGIDAIKKAVITCPLDAGANATVVMNQSTFAAQKTTMATTCSPEMPTTTLFR